MALDLPVLSVVSTKTPTVALVGNPNAGKTTLFNVLTGLRAKTGNYPGTTVDVRSGPLRVSGPNVSTTEVSLVDLPGLYSLDPLSPEEELTASVLRGTAAGGLPDAVVLVLDSTHLQRNLFLATEVLSLGLPTIVALSQFDTARKSGVEIDVPSLGVKLGCPVVPVSGRTGEGIEALKEALSEVVTGDCPVSSEGRPTCGVGCAGCAFSDRFTWAEGVVRETVRDGRKVGPPSLWDRLLTHPMLGVMAFLLVMLAVFYSIFTLAGLPMDLIDDAFA